MRGNFKVGLPMQAFQAWRINAREAKLHRRKLNKAVRRFSRVALAAAWNKWRDATLTRRRYVAIVAKCHSRMTSAALSRAFQTWCGQARAARRSTGVLEKALYKLANRKTAAAFALWKQTVAEAVTRKRVLDVSLRRMRSVALASAFGHWVGVMNSAKKQCEQVALVSSQKRLSRVSFSFKFCSIFLDPDSLKAHGPLGCCDLEVQCCEWGRIHAWLGF